MLDLFHDTTTDWNQLSRCADIVLAAVEVGPSGPAIKAKTGIPKHVIDNAGYRLRERGIWYGNAKRWGVSYEWWDKYETGEEEGLRGFWATVGIAAGLKTHHHSLDRLSQLIGISEDERRQAVPEAVKACNAMRRQKWTEHVQAVREQSAAERTADRRRRLERQERERVKARWAAARKATRKRERLERIKVQRILAQAEERLRQREAAKAEKADAILAQREARTLERFKVRQARLGEGWWEDAYGSLRPPDGWDWSTESLEAPFGDLAGFTLSDTLSTGSDFVESVAMEWDYYQLCIQICESYRSLLPIPNVFPNETELWVRRQRRMPIGVFSGFPRNDKLARVNEGMPTFNKGSRTFHPERDEATLRHVAEREADRREQLRRDGVLVK